MSEFCANGDFLDRKHFFTKYYLLIKDISFGASDVESAMNKLRNYSGFGIEEQVANLKKCSTQLKVYKEDVRTEFYSLVKIVDAINDYESRAKGVLGGNISKSNEFVLAQPEPLTKSLSNSDLGKLLNQLKYYTQSHADAKKVYDMLKKMYDSNETFKMTDSDYNLYKCVLTSIFARDYVYSSVEYFEPTTKDETKGILQSSSTSNKVTLTDQDKYEAKNRLDITVLSQEKSFDASAMKITTMKKIGNDYKTDVLTLSHVKVSEGVDFLNFDIGNLFKGIKDKKTSISDISDFFNPFGIEISGSTSAIQGVSTYTHKFNDDISYYNKNVYTIGELTSEFDISATEAKAKVGYSVASVKSSHGFKTNNGTYSISGKINAGQEYGVEVGASEAEVSVSMFSLGVEVEDGFDYYVWQ